MIKTSNDVIKLFHNITINNIVINRSLVRFIGADSALILMELCNMGGNCYGDTDVDNEGYFSVEILDLCTMCNMSPVEVTYCFSALEEVGYITWDGNKCAVDFEEIYNSLTSN